MTIEQRVATMVSVSLAKCLSLLLAAALVVGVWPIPIEQRGEKSPTKQSVNGTRVQLEEPPPPKPKTDELPAEVARVTAKLDRMLARWKPRATGETHRQRLERAAKRRHEYKQTCIETLKKILGLAEKGDLAYIPVLVRAEIRKVIDSDDYYDLCRAFNAMIAVGIVAPAYEFERERWRGNLDEPWSLLDRRTREAIVRHKQAGGTVRVLARPQFFPHAPPKLW